MRYAKDTVEQYLHAFFTGDSATARRYLADDLSFSGPSASFASAEALLRASAHVGSSVRAVNNRGGAAPRGAWPSRRDQRPVGRATVGRVRRTRRRSPSPRLRNTGITLGGFAPGPLPAVGRFAGGAYSSSLSPPRITKESSTTSTRIASCSLFIALIQV